VGSKVGGTPFPAAARDPSKEHTLPVRHPLILTARRAQHEEGD